MQNCNKVIISCATAAFSLLCGCTSGEGEGLNDRTGRINLSVTADKTIEQVTARSTDGPDMSFLESLSAQDLAIVLQSTEGESYSRKWSSLAEFPAEEEFPVGNYMITAYYGQTDAEGYDQPFLYGTTDFSVISERETEVSLTATIANSIVYIEPTDNFRNYFQTYSLSITSPRGYSINIADNDARPVYVNPGTVTINASVTLPSGRQGNITLGRFTAKATTLQRVTLNVENNSGDAVLSVEFDETLAEEQIRLNLSEDLFNAAPPEINTEGFTSDNNSFSFVENTFDGECAINIAAQAGLANAKLIISDGESEGTDYDLLDPESLAVLSELGIKFINVNTGSKLAKINLKEYLENMESKDLFTSRSTSMKLEVTDALTRSEEIALNTTVRPREVFELKPCITDTRNDSYILLAPSYKINVSSNLGDAENPGIEWSVVDIDGNELAQPALNIGETPGEFTLAFTTPEKASDFTVTAKAEGKQDHTWNIHVPRCNINEIKDYDVWATHTHFTLEPENEEDLDIILSRLDIQGGSYTQIARENDNLTFDLTELNPGTDYNLTVALAETSQQSFTTEAATQLPNSDMEDWYVNKEASNWTWYFANIDSDQPWGTNNDLTTTRRTSTTNNYSYNTISGTIPTEDAKKGKAALIRTVGWGDNRAYGTISDKYCQNTDAGLLHLGNNPTNSDKEVKANGIDFSSRPNSISFWYKYQPKNSDDYGWAEIIVRDDNNNEIAKSEIRLDAQNEYKRITLPLNYSLQRKAQNIYVKFISTVGDTFLAKTSANFSYPNFGNLSDGKYVGSELYIDEIELHY